jgi:hypothetical protein
VPISPCYGTLGKHDSTLRRLSDVSNKTTITITLTVDADDWKQFRDAHTGEADLRDSFNARLDEVYSSGPELLTTIDVQSVRADYRDEKK